MTMECYHSNCKYHSCHIIKDEGPFCDEEKCLATEEEQKQFEKEREKYLKKYSI